MSTQQPDGIRVRCKCGVTLKVKTGGVIITCPKCQTKLKVPAGTGSAPKGITGAPSKTATPAQPKKSAPVPGSNEATELTEPLASAKNKLAKGKGGKKKVIIFSSVAVVLIALIAGGYFIFFGGDSGSSQKQLAQNTKGGATKGAGADTKGKGETPNPMGKVEDKGEEKGKVETKGNDDKGKAESKGKEEKGKDDSKGKEEKGSGSEGPGIGKYLLPEFIAAVTIQPGKILENPIVKKKIPEGALAMAEIPGGELKLSDVNKVYILMDTSISQAGLPFGPRPGLPKGKGGPLEKEFPDKGSKEKDFQKGKDKNEEVKKGAPKDDLDLKGSPFDKGPKGFPPEGPGPGPASLGQMASLSKGMAILITTKKPIPVATLEKFAPPDALTKADHKGTTLYVAKEIPPIPGAPPLPPTSFALAFPEPTIAIAGTEALVKKMLDGGAGNPSLAGGLSAGVGDVQLLFVFEKIRPLLGLIAGMAAQDVPPEFKDVPKLLATLDSLSLDLDLSGNDLLKLKAVMTEEESVKGLENLVKMGLEHLKMLIKEFKPLVELQAPPDAKPFLDPLFAELEKGLKVTAEGKSLSVTLPRPAKFGE